jgi:cellulose synthase/poly-beta-1,6-N-acetylglucosamine synthase-like glycosyltransferase
MNLPLYYYVLGTPLGLLGLIRWGAWLIRRIPAVAYRPIDNDHTASLAIVVPVYQEDPDILATAIESWLANRVDQVILVIDASDTVCRAVAHRYPVEVIITEVPGKRDALRRGWRAARTELVALVDSDTVWAPDVAVEVCKPFADPGIGGVGTRQSVYGARGFLARVTDMFLDHRYFDENASQSYLGQAVSCLSGRTAVYRRHVLLEIEQEFLTETFWGVPSLSGDDKRLTTLTLERGYRTYMQRSAEVWSTFPDRWRIFFKQRTRWARNTWRSDLRALSRRWVWRHPFLAYTMIDKGVSSFTLLVGPAFLVYSLIVQNWIFCLVLVAWWQLSRAAKLLPHIRQRPSSFFVVLPYVVVSWVMALIKIYALLTIRKQKWGTRQVAVENGEVVRTGTDDQPSTDATPLPTPHDTEPIPALAAVVQLPARGTDRSKVPA